MAFIKGNSSSSTQATEILADIESLMLANGWTKLGVWDEDSGGVWDWHFFESDGQANGDRDFVVGIRIQANGAGHLSFIVAEEVDWQNGLVRIHAPHDVTSTHKVLRPRHGGVWDVIPINGVIYGNAAQGNHWTSVADNNTWTTTLIGPSRRQVAVEDAAMVQWMLKVEPDGIVLSTYRTQAGGYSGAWVLMGTSLFPFAPNPIGIGHLSTNNHLNQITGTVTRMPVNPDFEPYMDPFPDQNNSYDFSRGFQFTGGLQPGNSPGSATVGSVLNAGMTPWWIGPAGSPFFIQSWRSNMRIFDPEDEGVLLQDSNLNMTIISGWFPYIVNFITAPAINFGDEVQGPGNVRYVFIGQPNNTNIWCEK